MRDALSLAGAVWAGLAALFTLVTLARLTPRARGPAVVATTTPEPAPPVLLLRPVDAPSAHELECLAAPIDYDGPLEHVVLSPEPLPLPPHVRQVTSDPDVPNRKVGHLLRALERLPARGRHVLAVDADVAVDAALVRALLAPLARGAALSTAPPRPSAARGLGPRAARALLCNTHHSFVALHAMSAGAKTVCGKALGLGPAALAELPALAHHAGEDLELARRLRARGLSARLADAPARVPQRDRAPLADALARHTRWLLVLRAHRPALYPTVPLVFAPSLPLAALLLGAPSWPLACAVGALLAARTLLALRLAPASARDWPLGEGLLLWAFARSLARRTMVWRGRAFRLRAGGKMERSPRRDEPARGRQASAP